MRKMVRVEDLHFRDLRHAGVSWLFEMDWDIPAALHPLRRVKRTWHSSYTARPDHPRQPASIQRRLMKRKSSKWMYLAPLWTKSVNGLMKSTAASFRFSPNVEGS
ncbi:hypothetical protein CXB65_15655 [Pseudomonas monteilii]|uniref:Integrase n=1 Tax=Pseudomonas monteilii TaxID=76759 RepID=A0A2N1IQN3_9PSED|nr:hypothetical protein B7H19_09130 [Pseudomonas putida]PKI20900.1 hypothetical protein CXB65_15655 [Pseudomonas monteilii]RPD94182.1 hypothetical protein EGN69_09595 [Pseudomonas monteilii]